MNKLLYPFIALTLSLAPYRPGPAETIPREETFSIYELAEMVTGAPREILRGIAFAESSERDTVIGDDGRSMGRFQINEDFHTERAKKYGEYDPFDAMDAAIVAGRLYVDNLERLGSRGKAIAAHRQGVAGVRENGVCAWYVERVLSAGCQD